MFAGFPFGLDNRFTYLEGKRILRLALGELKQNRRLRTLLGMDPKAPGRPAITGRQEDRVWDFLSLSGDGGNLFTSHPHLTLCLRADRVEAMVTVPHSVNGTMRRNLVGLGQEGFYELVRTVIDNLAPMLRDHPGAKPCFVGVQRRYPSQRAVPFNDATIEFDLRTAVAASGPPKSQPRWLEAAYGSFVDKRGANYQIQIGMVFPYEQCPQLRRPDAIALVEAAWLACKPLIDLARAGSIPAEATATSRVGKGGPSRRGSSDRESGTQTHSQSAMKLSASS
jgi:hypothetical protein